MGKEGSWPGGDEEMLPSKIGKCVWWLAVLAERNGINVSASVDAFLNIHPAELSKY